MGLLCVCCIGVLNGAQLGAGEVLQHRLRCGEVDAALSILGNMDWCVMGADCYRGLISVTDHLLRKALDEQTEGKNVKIVTCSLRMNEVVERMV